MLSSQNTKKLMVHFIIIINLSLVFIIFAIIIIIIIVTILLLLLYIISWRPDMAAAGSAVSLIFSLPIVLFC